jgi:antitoxin component of RelBE/YafQ-DinJ toxin-antitoxin module
MGLDHQKAVRLFLTQPAGRALDPTDIQLGREAPEDTQKAHTLQNGGSNGGMLVSRGGGECCKYRKHCQGW